MALFSRSTAGLNAKVRLIYFLQHSILTANNRSYAIQVAWDTKYISDEQIKEIMEPVFKKLNDIAIDAIKANK